jgi:hypothetical protein
MEVSGRQQRVGNEEIRPMMIVYKDPVTMMYIQTGPYEFDIAQNAILQSIYEA